MLTKKTIVILPLLLLPVATHAAPAAPISPAIVDTAKPAVDNPMVGKRVLGKSREFLGTVTSVDSQSMMAELKSTGGAIVQVPLNQLKNEDDHLRAENMSAGDVLALIRERGQNGVFEVSAPAGPAK